MATRRSVAIINGVLRSGAIRSGAQQIKDITTYVTFMRSKVKKLKKKKKELMHAIVRLKKNEITETAFKKINNQYNALFDKTIKNLKKKEFWNRRQFSEAMKGGRKTRKKRGKSKKRRKTRRKTRRKSKKHRKSKK